MFESQESYLKTEILHTMPTNLKFLKFLYNFEHHLINKFNAPGPFLEPPKHQKSRFSGVIENDQ